MSDVKGCAEPRVYTPPLRELTPDTTLGFDIIDFSREVLQIEPHPWQCWFLIHAFETVDLPDGTWRLRFRTIILLVGRQCGKALDLDTDIPTPNGWRKMRDIHEGDYVFGKDGKPSRVLVESEIFDKPMYRVTFEDGATIDASADHIWTVSTKRSRKLKAYKPKSDRKRFAESRIHDGEWFEVTTEQMANDYVLVRQDTGRNEFKYRVPMPSEVGYPERELPIHPYLLGAWLGDGTSEATHITIGDGEIAEMVPLLEACGYPLTRKTSASRLERAPLFTVGTPGNKYHPNEFGVKLKELGVWGNKHIPDAYLTASVEQRWELLRGLMDTDGYCAKNGQCEFVQKSKAMAEGVVELCASLGLKAKIHEKAAKCNGKDAGTVYRVIFFTTRDRSCFKLKRKTARLKESLTQNVNGKSITKVERIESKPSKCIMVDNPSHLYLAGRQYTPTHNTTLGTIIALYFLYQLGVALILGTAQDVANAEDIWALCVEMAQANEELAEQIRHVWFTNGAKRLQLTGGRDYRVKAANRKAGRGKSADLVLLDELREHQTWDAYAALSKTGMARKNALLLCMSNAGDGTSVVLRHFRIRAHRMLGDPDGIVAALGDTELLADSEAALEDTALGLFEWSAAPGMDITDPRAWAQGSPSLGYTIDFATMKAACADDPADVFKTECLCQWVTSTVDPPFPIGAWDAGKDEQSDIASDAQLWWGVDISADRLHAAIAVCGKRDDGDWHAELAAYRGGTGWLASWFANAAPNYPEGMKVALQSRGAPVSSMLDVLEAIDGVEIIECQGKDVAGWSGRLWDAVAACDVESDSDATPVRHRPQPALDLAANIAATRPMGDGAWAFDRAKSMEDISPLVAVCMAHGAATAVDAGKGALVPSAYEERGVLVV